MDRPTVTHAISGCHVILTCIKVIQSQLPPDSRVAATSRRRPPLAADSDTPENLAEVVGQADR